MNEFRNLKEFSLLNSQRKFSISLQTIKAPKNEKLKISNQQKAIKSHTHQKTTHAKISSIQHQNIIVTKKMGQNLPEFSSSAQGKPFSMFFQQHEKRMQKEVVPKI